MSKALKFIKGNLFLIIVVLAYIVLTIVSPAKGAKSIDNSLYYIKEMLMIMPVIFVLTALLDSFVPKKTIDKYLGRDSKIKGTFFAFVLGSISAGPIYAAFPVCVMLHRKGASIKNIIILLSSWAVIKIPMLLNEAKFLGIKFMALRWLLTILAILLFSYIAEKIVKDSDIPDIETADKKGVYINNNACMGCTLCTKKYPELFIMDGKEVIVYSEVKIDIEKLNTTIDSCPVKAIGYIE